MHDVRTNMINADASLAGRRAAAHDLAAITPDLSYPALSAFITRWVAAGRDDTAAAGARASHGMPSGSAASMWDDAVKKVNAQMGIR